MIVLKCKCCGGTVIPKENGIGECDSCGRMQTIPNTNDEKKMSLLDRANNFRMQNEFDKALAIYEQVLEEDTEDSDVYYAIALCRYGITYVDDPKTKKKMPTINRMQSKMFTKDPDFAMALQKAEPEQVKLYNEEGSYIDKIQAGILDISKNEKPYDVFICYKETDDNGERTNDSVLAYKLYDILEKEGFKVFFSRITLEGKLGIAYEPYIFSALNSSKVMVVLGTKKEYFNAVWVKNEWSRYLKFINDGEKKILIPVYKDMDPYDLPEEIVHIQGLDLSKPGAEQDLVHIIKKFIGRSKHSEGDLASDYKQVLVNKELESALKRIKVYIEEKNWKMANEYCEKALDIDAENGEVCLCKLLVDTKCTSIDDLKECEQDFSELLSYSKVLKYANEDIIKQLKDINSDVNDKINFNLGINCINENEYKEVLKEFINEYEYKYRKLLKKHKNEYSNALKNDINTIDIEYKENFESVIDLIRKKQHEAKTYFERIVDKNKYTDRIENENERYGKLIEELHKEDEKIRNEQIKNVKEIRNKQITEIEKHIGFMSFNIKCAVAYFVIPVLLTIMFLDYPEILPKLIMGSFAGIFCLLAYFFYCLFNTSKRLESIKKINELYDENNDSEKKLSINQTEQEYNKKVKNFLIIVFVIILIIIIIFFGVK